MAKVADIWIGTAGWSIPRATASRFDSVGTHLERYSRRLRLRGDQFVVPPATRREPLTRSGVTALPAGFQFAVKIPRTITHELKLQNAREPFITFLAQTDGLADKRGPTARPVAAVAVV